ncbi:AAA family ATPase [Dyadobacter sp. 50-39]|uniref:AAA family ATPase n=1 Tax=Dyadobacter sp. 50-39 TaxID=1895756 RepID=UPI000AA15CD7|nr:AAA family ATPase [Dyadobacter sp. 50-39]
MLVSKYCCRYLAFIFVSSTGTLLFLSDYMGIHSIEIKNYRSIAQSGEILIKPLNVLIGENGAGKSNFIGFFKFLNQLYERRLQLYINQNGRAENILYFGKKGSDILAGRLIFDNEWKNEYHFRMIPDQSDNLIFSEEWSNLTPPGKATRNRYKISNGGNLESEIRNDKTYRTNHLRGFFESFKVFHFHDTSFSSKMKQPSSAGDYAAFYDDGRNLAAFLYRLQEVSPSHFKLVERVVQSIAPYFDRFYLQPDEINPSQIFLRWQEKGWDQLFSAHSLSDGTLRMICLATLLLQPNLPSVIIIDEPELGLHPFAIQKLASLIKSASERAQIIISTQSVGLVNQFSADDVIVVDRRNGQSVFTRQSDANLETWLQEYSLGELWEKNVLKGRPQ